MLRTLRLAKCHPSEVITQQIAWLPLRNANTNRFGLLRRAIEQDWAKPETSALSPEQAVGTLFVQHFEAALHGYAELPTGCSPKEAALATGFLRELSREGATPTRAADWGRQFGQFIRAKSPCKPWLAWVLRVYGGEFLRQCRQTARRDDRVSVAQSRRAHEERFSASYQEYLRESEERFKREQPALYAAFEAYGKESNSRFNLSEKTRQLLESETSRLSAFVDFMREHEGRVLQFWEWDIASNPQGWHNRSAASSNPEEIAPRMTVHPCAGRRS